MVHAYILEALSSSIRKTYVYVDVISSQIHPSMSGAPQWTWCPQDWACPSYKGWLVPWGWSSQVISRTWSGKGRHMSRPPKGVALFLTVEVHSILQKDIMQAFQAFFHLINSTWSSKAMSRSIHSVNSEIHIEPHHHGTSGWILILNLAWPIKPIQHGYARYNPGQFNMTRRANSTQLWLSFSRLIQHDPESQFNMAGRMSHHAPSNINTKVKLIMAK